MQPWGMYAKVAGMQIATGRVHLSPVYPPVRTAGNNALEFDFERAILYLVRAERAPGERRPLIRAGWSVNAKPHTYWIVTGYDVDDEAAIRVIGDRAAWIAARRGGVQPNGAILERGLNDREVAWAAYPIAIEPRYCRLPDLRPERFAAWAPLYGLPLADEPLLNVLKKVSFQDLLRFQYVSDDLDNLWKTYGGGI